MTNWRALCEELVLGCDVDGCDWKPQHQARWNAAIERARALLAQPEPEVVGPSVEELDDLFNEIDQSGEPLSWRAYARAVLSRWGRPAPATEEEVAKLVRWLRRQASAQEAAGTHWAGQFTRAADLLERQAAPVPVAVSERLPGPEDCDAEHYCWRWNTIGRLWARQPLARSWYEFESHWLPAHALPLPSGEAE